MGEHEEDELRRDLAASVEARRELGPAYEDDLVRSFVERLGTGGAAGIIVAWADIAGVNAAYAWGRPRRR